MDIQPSTRRSMVVDIRVLEEEPEDSRVMSVMFTMMMDKTRLKDFLKNMAWRDIEDVTVLRKIKVLQLAVLTDKDRIRMLYTLSSKV